jgi:tripartite-type tricarboxylate transporter receptor subunit TctC
MNKFSNVITIALVLAVLISFAGIAAAQPEYPNRPIRFIIAYAPGASSDNVARIYGQKLHESWGQPVVNDFKPGGNTIIASEALVKSAPDGYSILLVLNTHAINPLLTKLPYDPIKDFAPVATLGVSEYMLAIYPGIPANNLKDLIAYAKSRPGELNYSSSGAGGLGHLSGELFNVVAGIKTQHIPFKGGAPSVIALISGEVQLCFVHPINVLGQIKTGKLKAIAISGKNRLAALPDMPTFAEAGLPSFDSTNWFGVLAPAATPRDIINKLSAELTRIQALPDVKDKLSAQGVEPLPGGPEQFAALIKSDMEKFAKVVKSANIKLEN